MPRPRHFGSTARALLAALAAAVVAFGHGVTAAPAQDGSRDYVALVDQYAAGQTEEAAQALAAHETAG